MRATLAFNELIYQPKAINQKPIMTSFLFFYCFGEDQN